MISLIWGLAIIPMVGFAGIIYIMFKSSKETNKENKK